MIRETFDIVINTQATDQPKTTTLTTPKNSPGLDFDISTFKVNEEIFTPDSLPLDLLYFEYERDQRDGCEVSELARIATENRTLIFRALVSWIDVIKSPEWGFSSSEGVLDLFSRFDNETLAGHGVIDMFKGFQQILIIGEGWEHMADQLPSASDISHLKALYLQQRGV